MTLIHLSGAWAETQRVGTGRVGDSLSLWLFQGSHTSHVVNMASFVIYPERERDRSHMASEVTLHYLYHILLVEAVVELSSRRGKAESPLNERVSVLHCKKSM